LGQGLKQGAVHRVKPGDDAGGRLPISSLNSYIAANFEIILDLQLSFRIRFGMFFQRANRVPSFH
jgi:hypothetical protein